MLRLVYYSESKSWAWEECACSFRTNDRPLALYTVSERQQYFNKTCIGILALKVWSRYNSLDDFYLPANMIFA